MSVLTNFPAIPNRIAIACEYLQSAGVSGVSRETFERHLSPLRGEHEEDQTGTPMSRSVLKELEQLGLAVPLPGNVVRLADGLADRPRDLAAWQALLVPKLRKLLLREEASERGQRDVPEAIAWFLCQDPLEPIKRSGQHAELFNRQFVEGDSGDLNIANDQRFQNLVYWARYLGLAETVPFPPDATEAVIPDPTRAIRGQLPAVFELAAELPVETFVDRLAQLLPVLENGSARGTIERRLKTKYQREDHHFSQATSLALRRLEFSSELQPHLRSDAATWVRVDGRATAPISHFRFGARA